MAQLPETGGNAAQTSGRDPELLSDESALRSGRSSQQQSPPAHQPRAGIQDPEIPATESQADGGDQHGTAGISHGGKSRMKWTPPTDSRSEPKKQSHDMATAIPTP